MHLRALISLLLWLLLIDVSRADQQPANAAAMRVSRPIEFRITRTIPHDPRRFTQGLLWHEGLLFESTGRYGESGLYALNPANGATLKARALPPDVFAEGLAVVDRLLVQLTWREQRAFLHGDDLTPRGEWRYGGEGWGLTHDGRQFVMSDGSSELQFRRSEDFRLQRRVTVHEAGEPVTMLNELEIAHGLVLANLWRSDRIAAIDPASGAVLGWLEMGALRGRFQRPPGFDPNEHVLNGIAHDPQRDRYYLTGKGWPLIFEMEIPELSGLLTSAASTAVK